MSKLRIDMMTDLAMGGYAVKTQEIYIDCIEKLANHFGSGSIATVWNWLKSAKRLSC